MNEKQLKDAERRYQNWSDSDLVRATTVEKQDYEARACIAVEYGYSRNHGVDFRAIYK
jgi:hypothetical protein